MKKIFFILFLFPFIARGTDYFWNPSNGNAVINRTNFPLATHGDRIFIPPKSGGYRSISLDHLFCGIIAPDTSQLIHVICEPGFFITPSSFNLFANLIDSLYGVELSGVVMQDHIDPLWSGYGATGYIKYFWQHDCNIRGTDGIFSSSIPSLSLPAFTGDSTNCFFHWRLSHFTVDSLDGGNSGNTAFRFGNVTGAKNQFWVYVEIDHSFFGHYSSAGGPANYLAGSCCFGVLIHDDTVVQLGMNVTNPSGHAASVIIASGQVFMWNMIFGPRNFGNDIRILGDADMPGWFTGIAGTNGRSFIHNCITFDKRKYPFCEPRTAPSDTSTLSPFVRVRTSPQVWNITAYNLAVGAGLPTPSAYIASIIDCYETDSVWGKNLIFIGLIDTTWGNPAYMGVITAPNGPISRYDTASLRLIQFFANSGIQDTIKYTPVLNGTLYNQGVAVPSYIINDIYGYPIPTVGRSIFGLNTGVDIGAVQFPLTNVIGPIPVGVRIKII